jgi:putative membrane protein
MDIAADVLVGLVALIHAYFLVLEMFLWRTPVGRKVFGTDQDFADRAAALAANQGLYNGILAAGLVWSFFAPDRIGYQVRIFLLTGIVVAGVYGAITVNRRILLFQALPAALALGLVLLA